MQPYLKYFKAFKMDDGTKPALTVGKDYELNCAFMSDETTGLELVVSIIDDRSMVHTFWTEEEWFSEHFTIVGDVDLVMEQI